jgi:hypothetical protein
VVADSDDREAAAEFAEKLRSAPGREALDRAGFVVPS